MHTLGTTSVAALWRYLDYAEDQLLDTKAALAAARIVNVIGRLFAAA